MSAKKFLLYSEGMEWMLRAWHGATESDYDRAEKVGVKVAGGGGLRAVALGDVTFALDVLAESGITASEVEIVEEETFAVGDTIITADGDTGTITEMCEAEADFDEDADCPEYDRGPGVVADFGRILGKVFFPLNYISHFTGPLPEFSQGFMGSELMMAPASELVQ